MASSGVRGKPYVLLIPAAMLLALGAVVPLAALAVIGFWTQDGFDLSPGFTLENYARIFDYSGSPIYLRLLGRSIVTAVISTATVILTAYPMAYFIAFKVGRHKMLWLILITIPLWTSYLLRVFSWKVILGYDGLINSTLTSIGIVAEPLEFLLYNPIAVTITLTHAWAAYAILPIYVSLEKIDRTLIEASEDLGDSPFRRFRRIILPLSAPGTIAATLLVFIPTVGDYVTAALVGGPGGMMVGNLIQSLFGKENNIPLGAALSFVMMAAVTVLAVLFAAGGGRAISRWGRRS